MKTAYVLMTAMPPTKGHLRLIQFAQSLTPYVKVILCTQPGEPWHWERFTSLMSAVPGVVVKNLHRSIPQVPADSEDFWDMWRDILHNEFYFSDGDYIVASESYGVELAQAVGGIFMPYDVDREMLYTRATDVRSDMLMNFDQMIPEFQEYVRKTVTIFGAESTGKTTLARGLSRFGGHFLFEWARPYLETVGSEITTEKMTNIWQGQRALQDHAQEDFVDQPFIIQDTDLFSTIGYWNFWNMGTPQGLVDDAISRKSDLYIITPSNIPFEADPLRYGGDVRESTDQYWVDLCERYDLNYVVLDDNEETARKYEAAAYMVDLFDKANHTDYVRSGQ